jgi:hypothetical protein
MIACKSGAKPPHSNSIPCEISAKAAFIFAIGVI